MAVEVDILGFDWLAYRTLLGVALHGNGIGVEKEAGTVTARGVEAEVDSHPGIDCHILDE